jgi:hypothetical protein
MCSLNVDFDQSLIALFQHRFEHGTVHLLQRRQQFGMRFADYRGRGRHPAML